ncbi:hypothetical protein CWI39_0012p0030 [Hamiltosporidium magnivora]|uniref:Uncharacterized protein n=1 Tax=Hamiltosporidium magnivora TaxID=148818 RepID=A0A4Q9LNE2_9MICR|nr:hypothetical protein CWI39_0012p0030 [Hamiltosporidium magnivora]
MRNISPEQNIFILACTKQREMSAINKFSNKFNNKNSLKCPIRQNIDIVSIKKD